MGRQIRNAYFESLFNKVREAIALCDNQGRVIQVNTEFRRMFGYAQAEAFQQSIDDLIAPGSREARDYTEAVRRGETFAGEAIRQRKDGTRIHVSILGASIRVHGRQVATYAIYRDITDQKEAERALLESQRQVQEANAALQERTRQLEAANARLEQLSNLDGLTAIPNRRHFEATYRTEWRRACRGQSRITLVMIDVDFFKSYNDHHGHLAGDECLKRIARALGEGHRAGDLVARYGGEEFVALLTGNTPGGTLQAAERMRQQVQDLAIGHGHSEVAPVVTVSLGVASTLASPEQDAMDLLAEADRALYRAKTLGRNRVEAAEQG